MRIKVADLRELEKQVLAGDISYSRMVERLNEIAAIPVEPLEFVEWVEKNYSFVEATDKTGWVDKNKYSIYIHGSHEYKENLISAYGLTTQQLYQYFIAIIQP